MPLVKQASINPTRKLSAAVLATAMLELARVVTIHFLPDFSDPNLWAALTPVVVFGVGYLVHDEANTAPVQ